MKWLVKFHQQYVSGFFCNSTIRVQE